MWVVCGIILITIELQWLFWKINFSFLIADKLRKNMLSAIVINDCIVINVEQLYVLQTASRSPCTEHTEWSQCYGGRLLQTCRR